MKLSDIIVPDLVNQQFKTYRPDSFWSCYDRWHYLRYPHSINYQFNSRGFRDQEWPQDLTNAVWCIGDSVTVGVGAPAAHAWPQQLAQVAGVRTINLGIRGTNNATIATMASTVLREVQPKNMVIVWSIFERRPKDTNSLLNDSYSQQLIASDAEHIRYFEQCLNLLERGTNIVHAFVPHYFTLTTDTINKIWADVSGPSWPGVPHRSDEIPNYVLLELEELNVRDSVETALYFNRVMHGIVNNLGEIKPRDLARDGTHFDILTSQALAHQIAQHLI